MTAAHLLKTTDRQQYSRHSTLGQGVRDRNIGFLKASKIKHALTRHLCYFVPLKPSVFYTWGLRERIYHVLMLTSGEWHWKVLQCSPVGGCCWENTSPAECNSELRESTSFSSSSANISWASSLFYTMLRSSKAADNLCKILTSMELGFIE